MKGYWFILGTDITDEEAQQKYGSATLIVGCERQCVISPEVSWAYPSIAGLITKK